MWKEFISLTVLAFALVFGSLGMAFLLAELQRRWNMRRRERMRR